MTGITASYTAIMSNDFSMYRFYKGEEKNPFNQSTQNTEHMFWFYESVFDADFAQKESSDWYSFFNVHDLGDDFMKLLSEGDYDKPQDGNKKQVFELWLNYLFTFKLYPEYGGENAIKKLYYSIAR